MAEFTRPALDFAEQKKYASYSHAGQCFSHAPATPPHAGAILCLVVERFLCLCPQGLSISIPGYRFGAVGGGGGALPGTVEKPGDPRRNSVLPGPMASSGRPAFYSVGIA